MSEYAERFAENRIDLSVLPDLTDQDLEKLGVVLGDRRKMLRAIGELSVSPPAPLKPCHWRRQLRRTPPPSGGSSP
jgi:SAM domain (Sterile alpha motif)